MTAYVLVGLLLLILVGLPAYKIYLKNSTRIRTPNGVSSLEELALGGLRQWIFIRGRDQKNPVLLFLHGGPGEPVLGISGSRIMDAELIEHFTIVHWDQRGAGKSYQSDIPVDSMTIDRLVADCNELIDYLRNRFNMPKVFLVAHSSGTPIGIKTAHMYPEKIHAYVGVGQIINFYEQEMQSYEFIVEEAEKSRDAKKQAAIKAIGPPPYETPEKFFKKAAHIVRYGGFIHHNPIRHMAFIILCYLTSPEYSLSDALNTVTRKGLNFTTNARWEETKNIDFTKEIQSIKVPLYFFIGKYDMTTPTVSVEDFFKVLDAQKGKQLILFENSAHFPIVEEKKKYQDMLVNVVLKESHNQ